jgi:hypothetical protein
MKILPWFLTIVFAATTFLFYAKTQETAAEMAKLRAAVEQVQASHEDAGAYAGNVDQNELERLRKENEEVYRLRNEVTKLQKEKQTLTQQLQVARANAAMADQTAQNDPVVQEEPPADPQTELQRQQAEKCIHNLEAIEEAKTMWAVAHNKNAGENVTLTDITSALPNNTMPLCPAGGVYNLNQVGIPCSCSIPGHSLLP